MKIIIVSDDQTVRIDGVSYQLTAEVFPADIHAIHWDSILQTGNIERIGQGEEVITDFTPYQYLVDAWIIADTPTPPTLEENRLIKISEIKQEAIRRIMLAVPAINSFEMVDFMRELWPALNTAALGPDMLLAKDIVVYVRTKIDQAKTATQAQLDGYDPITDTGWPT